MTPTTSPSTDREKDADLTAPLHLAGPRGAVIELRAGDYRAELCEVGAAINALELAGRPLVLSSPLDGPALFHRGLLVAPWPNRLADGTYTWDGQELQVPLSEPERACALHGLVSTQRFTTLRQEESRAVLGLELVPSAGYPFHLLLVVDFALDAEEGLSVEVTARNLGPADLPYGVCPHPYLVAGPEPLDTWSLQIQAGTVMQVSPDRLLPTGMVAIEPGSELDLAQPTVIGETFLDSAVTDLQRDEQGMAHVRVTSPSGTGVELSFDERCPWLQLHTGDRPEPEHDRRGLAVEPMTCPPDAFTSGTDVVRLAPGAEHTAGWSIRGL